MTLLSAKAESKKPLFLSLIVLVLVLLNLTACGFQLRSYGESNASITSLSLDCPSTSNWELCHHLKQTLQLNRIDILEDAAIKLNVSQMKQKSRVLSLQANASAAEKGLSSEVSYSLSTVQDDELRHSQTVAINNSYRHESSALLAKDRERDELQMQLSQQIAEEIVRQISVLNTNSWFDQPTSQKPTEEE